MVRWMRTRVWQARPAGQGPGAIAAQALSLDQEESQPEGGGAEVSCMGEYNKYSAIFRWNSGENGLMRFDSVLNRGGRGWEHRLNVPLY